MIKEYLADTMEALARVDSGEVLNACEMIQKAKDSGSIVWVVGNGGSASTAEHFANDLVKIAGVRAIALPSLSPSILAYGNDNGWERMFADPLCVLKRGEGDILVAISCSGQSPNVLEAASLFHHTRLIVLTGNRTDSPLAGTDADAKIFVHDGDIRVQEDAHLAVCHAIAGEIR